MWRPIEAAVVSDKIALSLIAEADARLKVSNSRILEAYAKWERARYLPLDNLLDDVPVSPISGAALVHCSTENHLAKLCTEYNIEALLVSPASDRALGGMIVPTWRFQFGDGEYRRHLLPGLWEVVEQSPTMISLTESAPGNGPQHVLETVMIRTDPRSWLRNQLAIADKAASLLSRWLPPKPKRQYQCWAKDNPVVVSRSAPTNSLDETQAVIRMLARFGRHAIASTFTREQWQLAIDSSADSLQLINPQILIPPRDRFWADPFPIQKDGTLHVFIEEYLYSTAQGHISVLSRNSSGGWSEPTKVVDRPYHISYPFVFEHAGELFMLPETTSAGQIELYRCVEFPTKWELDTALVENFVGNDPTLFQQDDGTWWLIVDRSCDLHLFYSVSPRGPFVAHEGNPVKSDSRNTRPAGRIFRLGNDLVRPAQDCSMRYGREVVFNKIVSLNPESFEEVEIGRLRLSRTEAIGCHTFNRIDGITIVDRLVRRMKW